MAFQHRAVSTRAGAQSQWRACNGNQGGKRGTTKTTRNDYYGVGDGTWMEMDMKREGEGFMVVMRLK
jgi:hypothetical protein